MHEYQIKRSFTSTKTSTSTSTKYDSYAPRAARLRQVGAGRAGWGGWGGGPGGGGQGGMQAGRVGGQWYERSYSPKGRWYGGVKNVLRNRVA